jgi:hypothetical protein
VAARPRPRGPRGAELRVIGQAGVVGRQAHQRREPEPLLSRDREIAVDGRAWPGYPPSRSV